VVTSSFANKKLPTFRTIIRGGHKTTETGAHTLLHLTVIDYCSNFLGLGLVLELVLGLTITLTLILTG